MIFSLQSFSRRLAPSTALVTAAIAAPTVLEYAARQTPGQADSDQCEEHRNLECP